MTTRILAIGTATPACQVLQKKSAELMVDFLTLDGGSADRIRQLYLSTAIKKRGTVLSDEQNNVNVPFFKKVFSENPPGMSERNAIYQEKAPLLAYQAALNAINNWGENTSSITHVISVSCTGVITPGLELSLVNMLKLSPNTFRLGINFMGCFGALKGLTVAHALANENPNNRVLMVCTELCSLHMQPSTDPGVLVSNAIFADGAAACILGNDTQPTLFRIHDKASYFLDNTLDMMQWNGSDFGLEIQLSRRVPELIEKHISNFVDTFLKKNGVEIHECDWAIHPGGKAIVEAVEKELKLQKKRTRNSWDVLENHGNMSSPTVLFVLDQVNRSRSKNKWCCMLGFGPGLSIESVLLCKDQQKKSFWI